MKWYAIFGTLLLMIALLIWAPWSEHRPRSLQLAETITQKTEKVLKEHEHLYLVDAPQKINGHIEMLGMNFDYFQAVDLKEARALLVNAVETYLSEINQNAEITPYLKISPFTAKNIEIRIWIYLPNHAHLSPDKIHFISAIDGMLSYSLDLPETDSSRILHTESYEEASHLLQNQLSS